MKNTAYENFLPSYIGFGQGNYDYSATLTNHTWMMEMRNLLNSLISITSNEFCGLVDFDNVFDDSKEMREFAVKMGVVNS